MKTLVLRLIEPLGVKFVQKGLVGGVFGRAKIVEGSQLFFDSALGDVGRLRILSGMLQAILDGDYVIAVGERHFAGDILLIASGQNLACFEPAVAHDPREFR